MTTLRPTLGERIRQAYSLMGILLLNTLLLLLMLELGAQIVLSVRPAPSLAAEIAAFKSKMLALTYYRSQEWSQRYWDEHFQIVDNWSYAPYVLWQTRPYAGELIRVSAAGIRATPNSACQPASYRIWLFGGSTMWGYGVYDGATIPAYVQAALSDLNVCVINYAEVGFNSTQAVIRLLRLIQQGERPDLVVLYDGSNDVTSAQRTGQAGAHFYLENIQPVVRGEIVQQPGTQASAGLRDLLGATALYRLIVPEPTRPEPAWALPPYDPAFVTAIAETYLTNVGTARGLGAAYGFHVQAFLQPVLPLRQQPPNDEEQRFLWEMPGGLSELFQAVYAQWEAAPPEMNISHLGRLLDGQTQPMWIDFNHLTGWGNLVVGNAIVAAIRPQIEADRAAP